MPRPSLDQIFAQPSAPMGTMPIDEQRRATLEIFAPDDARPSLDQIFAQSPDIGLRPDQVPQMPADAVSQQPDFYQRVGQDMLKRGQNVKNQIVQGATGQQSWAETGFNTIGNAFGLAADVGANAITGAFNTLPKAVQQPIRQAGGYVADSAVGDVVGDYGRKYAGFAEANPRASNLINSAVNIGTMMPAQKAAQASTSFVKPIAEDVTAAVKNSVKLPEKAVKYAPISSGDLAQAKNNAYKYTMDTGAGIDGNGSGLVVDVLEGYRQKPSFEGAWLSDESAAINEAIDKFKGIRGKKGTIEDIQKFDSDLGDMAASAYVAGERNKGRIFSNMQDDIREKLTSDEMKRNATGSPEGIDVLFNHAIPLAATEFKLMDIKKVIDKGMSTTTPTKSVQTGLNNLMLNDKKFKRLPKEVQAEIAKAAKSGNFDDLLSIVGSRLNAIGGGAAGGVKGAAVGYAVGKTARSVRDRMMQNKTNKIYDKLLEPVRGSVERFRTMPEVPKQPPAPMKLLEYKPPPTDIQVGTQGAKKLSVAEQIALNAKRANKESLGGNKIVFTPEQRKLLAGIQRGSNGVARTVQNVDKPITTGSSSLGGKTAVSTSKDFNNSGRPTSLYTFIRNNGGLKDAGGDLASMGHKDLVSSKGMTVDSLGEKLLERGFFEERPTTAQVLKLIEDNNGGRKAYAPKDVDRIMTAQENAAAKKLNDPSYIEFTASNMGIDTQGKNTQQLLKEIKKIQDDLEGMPF